MRASGGGGGGGGAGPGAGRPQCECECKCPCACAWGLRWGETGSFPFAEPHAVCAMEWPRGPAEAERHRQHPARETNVHCFQAKCGSPEPLRAAGGAGRGGDGGRSGLGPPGKAPFLRTALPGSCPGRLRGNLVSVSHSEDDLDSGCPINLFRKRQKWRDQGRADPHPRTPTRPSEGGGLPGSPGFCTIVGAGPRVPSGPPPPLVPERSRVPAQSLRVSGAGRREGCGKRGCCRCPPSGRCPRGPAFLALARPAVVDIKQ